MILLFLAGGCTESADSEEETSDKTGDIVVDAGQDTAPDAPKHPLEAITVTQSPAVTTVAIVEWLGDLSGVDMASIQEAYVEYGLGDTLTMRAPVDLTQPGMRTLLLGMKAGAMTYSIRSTLVAGGETYTSPVVQFETGYAPSAMATAERTYIHASLPVEEGYLLTGTFSGETYALVVDAEGDVVWWTEGLSRGQNNTGTSDFVMDWNGKYFYLVATNPENLESPIRRVSLDGQEVIDFPAGRAHHSLKPVPEGGVVFIQTTVDEAGEDTCDAVVHLDESGALTEVFNLSELLPVTTKCHVNFVGYDPAMDAFYVSSRNYDVAVFISRSKEIIWAIGRDDYETATSEDFEIGQVGDIVALHGLHIWNSGKNLLLFNNTSTSTSKIYGYEFDDTYQSASVFWSYERENAGSTELGGVQRLPGGNVQITYSIEGVVNQIAPSGDPVYRLDFSAPIGYGNWRQSLYGPPTEL
jgi:hypothetical protein